MERKIVLEVEELEERIAPHCAGTWPALGGGHAAVDTYSHGGGSSVGVCPPNGESVHVSSNAADGLARAVEGGG